MVRFGVPTASGRPWTDGAAGVLLRRISVRREEWAERDLEAIREPVEDLWFSEIRARPQLAIALNWGGIPSRTGRVWTSASAGRLIRDLGLTWGGSNVCLRRGDTAPGVIDVAGVDEPLEVIEAAAPVQTEQLADLLPQTADRRRAIRL